MKTNRMIKGVTLSLFLLITAASTTALAQQIAVRGETVYTMAGQPITDGVVLIRNGKIERVGSQNVVVAMRVKVDSTLSFHCFDEDFQSQIARRQLGSVAFRSRNLVAIFLGLHELLADQRSRFSPRPGEWTS